MKGHFQVSIDLSRFYAKKIFFLKETIVLLKETIFLLEDKFFLKEILLELTDGIRPSYHVI